MSRVAEYRAMLAVALVCACVPEPIGVGDASESTGDGPLYADTKPGNVDMALIDAGGVVVAESKGGSGLDVIYPRRNAALWRQVAQRGLLTTSQS